jgi:predicted nucleic acid-binding protein
VNTLIQINLNLSSFTENIAEYLQSTWEKIIPNLKETHSDKIPQIISSLIDLIKKNPEMSISSNPENKFDIKKFFEDEGEEQVQKEEKKAEIKTSETEEFSIFIKILNEFLEKCNQFCGMEQINNLIPISLKLIKYPNSDIQSEISKTLGLIIEILSKKGEDINNIQKNSKNFIAEIISQLLKETDFIVITSLLDSMKDIIKSTKLFLTTQEINDLTQNILKVFDIVETSRIAKLKQKKETEEEYEKNKNNKDSKINSDDEDDSASKDEEINDLEDQIDEIENVLTSFSEFFGVLFDTHKNYTLEFVDKIIKEYLPKYFKENASNFEKNLGVLLVGDMAEFLQQDIIGNIWDDICVILVKYANNSDDEVRNSACYGLGAFAQSTKNNFEKYYKDIVTVLISAINMPIDKNLSKDEKNAKQFAKDNGVSALGKILKYQGQALGSDYENVFNLWINNLPIKQDDEEGLINNQFLMDILMKEPNKVLGIDNKNLAQIIIILAKAYNSEMSDELLDTNIEQFALGVKNNKEYNEILMNLVQKQKGKTLNRIKTLFKL